MRELIIIGVLNGMPVAIDKKTGNIIIHTSDQMGSFFSDIGGVFSNHIGGLFDGGNKENKGSSFNIDGLWNSIGKVFDPNTQVGSVVNTGLDSYVQNLANGGSPSFNPFGLNPNTQFVPVQPQVITVQDQNVDNNASSGLFGNPVTLIIVGGAAIAAIALLTRGSKSKTLEQ